VDCKKKLAARIAEENRPIIERYQALVNEPQKVHEILRRGADQARAVALETMEEVHKLTGLR
jgi:tryptophanyl-tRNA synthetase